MTMSNAAAFQFVADPAAWKPPAGIVAPISAGIRSKQKLLAILADRLRFPAWTGRNWDALEESLRDLSWLPPGSVALVHQDLPFGPGGANRGIYLSILNQACRFWADDPTRKLVVILPASEADAVTSTLAAAEH
ncbi:MAG TPA: barstar family protein [Pirellulaceae bacterium]|nr:barstar family protein [Pirellulaceae bacterium]